MAELKDKLSSTKKKPYVERLEELSTAQEYQPTAPNDTRSTLREAIDRASQMYEKESNTNDWAEVGQMLGKAAAQFAAAQSGMRTGRNMGGLDTGPSIDYGARSDRAFRKYQQAISNSQTLAGAEKENFREQEAMKEKSFERRAEPLKLGAQAEREAARDAASDTRAAAAEDARRKRQQEIDAQRDRELNIRDTGSSVESLEKKLSNANTLLANEEVIDDMSTKDASKLQTKYAAAAGAAGIDLGQVKAEAEKAPEVDKKMPILGFSYKGKDPDRYKNALRSEIQKIQAALEQAKTRKQALLDRRKASESGELIPGPQNPAGLPPSDGVVSVRGPSGTVSQIKKSAWDTKYSKMQGYSLVP